MILKWLFFSLTRTLVIKDVKEVTCNFTGVILGQGPRSNLAQNYSGGFNTAHGSFRPMSQCLRHIWDWVDSSYQSICILQGLDCKSLLHVMVAVITYIQFCRIMVILGTFLFLLSKYRDSKANHKQRIYKWKWCCIIYWNSVLLEWGSLSECSLKMFFITVGAKVGKIETIFWITIWIEVKHLRIH